MEEVALFAIKVEKAGVGWAAEARNPRKKAKPYHG
jgi:hypothetical protein